MEPPYFCDQCAPHDATLAALRNSPRVGVGCYNNTHDEPETEEFLTTTSARRRALPAGPNAAAQLREQNPDRRTGGTWHSLSPDQLQ